MMSEMLCYKCSKPVNSGEFMHQGLHTSCFLEWFELTDIDDFKEISLREGGSDPDLIQKIANNNSSFFQGKFKKYSAKLSAQHYILKVREPNYPELPQVEYLSNQIAHQLTLPVAPFYLIRFQNVIDTFVTKNFISERTDANLIHIYRYIKENEQFNCETLISIISHHIPKISAINQFVEMCLFDALIGNHDRHGRNIGIIQTPDGLELAPIYDNPSNLGIEEYELLAAELVPCGKIETNHTNNPTMIDYVIEFKRMGYKSVIENFHKKVQKVNFIHLLEASFLSSRRKNALLRLINTRAQELQNGIL